MRLITHCNPGDRRRFSSRNGGVLPTTPNLLSQRMLAFPAKAGAGGRGVRRSVAHGVQGTIDGTEGRSTVV